MPDIFTRLRMNALGGLPYRLNILYLDTTTSFGEQFDFYRASDEECIQKLIRFISDHLSRKEDYNSKRISKLLS